MDLDKEEEFFGKQFEKYINDVTRANTEGAKAFLFLEFIRKVFGVDAIIAKIIPELEKQVKFKENVVIVRGRADALLGNLIIEFKDKLTELKLEDAEEQLRKYLYGLKSKVNFVAVATDGIQVNVYRPRLESKKIISYNQIYLDKIDKINLADTSTKEAFLWIDRYLLTKELKIPKAEEFSKEFGVGSPIYKISIDKLNLLWDEVNKEMEIIYKEWAGYLRIVYGSSVDSKELFLKHTYLATLSKLMVYMFYTGGTIPSSQQIKKVLDGTAFREWEIINFLEEDFFTWVSRVPDGIGFAKELIKQLSRYDLTQLNEDILKELYQNLVDPKERHDLGETYTPDWLAEYIIMNMLKPKARAKVLDPACGSGTFLVVTINLKKEYLKNSMEPEELLDHITGSVMGIDVHPLALIISRSNYIMALGNLLREGRKGKVIVPVYLSDSLKIPEKEKDVRYTDLEIYKREVDKNLIFRIPYIRLMVKRKDSTINITDSVIEAIKDYTTTLAKRNSNIDKKDFERYLLSQVPEFNNTKISRNYITAFFEIAETMLKLIQQNKDTIWAFILKNFYKPIMLLNRFDFVVGNPPWLSYRYVRSTDYQNFIKNLIINQYELTSKAELITQMELGTLFFVRSSEIYLNEKGEIGFVMPRSIFSGDQHDVFRRGKYKFKVGITRIVDLDKIKPLFNVPSCVVFGSLGHKTKDQFEGALIRGVLPRKNATFIEAKKILKFEDDKKFYLDEVGGRSFISAEKSKVSVGAGKSYYYDKFSQGATIVPRSFWFVNIEKHEKFGLNPKTPFIKTSKRAIEQAKKPYGDIKLEGNVESEFLYGTLTGSEIVPFGHLGIEIVILPLEIKNNKFVLLNSQQAQNIGKNNIADWLDEVEKLWKEKRGEKAEKLTIYKRINYSNGITNQQPDKRFKVVYNTSGTYLVSCLIDTKKDLDIKIDSSAVTLNGFLAESTSYVFEVTDKEEAYFLVSIFNSSLLDRLIKPMQAKGAFGERHIHKKPLEFPIPKFDPKNKLHLRLVELEEICAKKVEKKLPNLAQKYNSIGKIRSEIKKILEPEIKEIDSIVEKFLSNKSKNLFDYKESAGDA